MAEEDSSPGSVRGARVRRTGIALVHQGELVLPAAGSEAEADVVLDDAQNTIQYFFPVEIEVRGAPEAAHPSVAAELALSRLARGLRSQS
jgi:hypothetical protein